MTDRKKLIRAMEYCTGDIVPVDENDECLGDVCPFKEGGYESGDCQENMIRAALALLKEQEPHVLTLEECRDPGRMVALEYKTYGILKDDELKPVMTIHKWAVYIGKCFDGDIEWTAFSLFHAFTNQMTLKTDNYGKTWRCWSADPGDEVRMETKWDEE